MAVNSKFGASLGFQLAGNAAVVTLALGIVTTPNFCNPTLTISATATSIVLTRGSTSASGFRNSQLGAQLGFCLGNNLAVVEAHPNSVASVVTSPNRIRAVNIGVTALGIATTRGNAPVKISATAQCIVDTDGQCAPTVTQLGLKGIATCSGSIKFDLKATALGIAHAQAYVVATTAVIITSAKGQVRTQGSIPNWKITGFARGIVRTQGMGTIALSSSTEPCLEGPDGPPVPVKSNFAL